MSHGSSQDTKIEKKNFLNEIKKYNFNIIYVLILIRVSRWIFFY